MGAPTWPPNPPEVRTGRAQPVRSLLLDGGPDMAPKPPEVRTGRAQPVRSSV